MSFDPSKPVQTRDGRPVEILRDNLNNDCPILGIITHDNLDRVVLWRKDGSYVLSGGGENDLVNAPDEHTQTAWLVAKRGSLLQVGGLYGDRATAECNCKRYGCDSVIPITVTWKDGDGMDDKA
jgi:hypothetical protein